MRRNAFLKCIPELYIYESKEGQNWQLILPLAYHLRCGYINYPLFKYVQHKDSHSHKKRKFSQLIERLDAFNILLIETINRIPDVEYSRRQELVSYIKHKTIKSKIELSLKSTRIVSYFRFIKEFKREFGMLPKELTLLDYNINRIKRRWRKITRQN